MIKKEFRLKATEPFFFEYKTFFDKKELTKFNKFKKKLKQNPNMGDYLRVRFVREFKTKKGKRAYFLVYEEINLILFVALSNKKNQKTVINRIFEKLDEYKKFAYKL